MRSGRDEACQLVTTLQHLPSFLWGTTQKHRSKIRLRVALDVWPCCTSPSLRFRVSVPAVAAVSAMKDSCCSARAKRGQREEAGTSSRLANQGCLLPRGLPRSQLARRHNHAPSPTPRGWGGGWGFCRYPLIRVPQPREDQWTPDGQT